VLTTGGGDGSNNSTRGSSVTCGQYLHGLFRRVNGNGKAYASGIGTNRCVDSDDLQGNKKGPG
jgi:hypothetical protein